MKRQDNSRENPERHAVYTTIVGARPPGSGTHIGAIPRGIEVLVKKASVDAEFRNILLERRADAAAEIQLELTATEVAMLSSIPRRQLEAIVKSTKVKPESRRIFLGKVASLMLATLGVQMSGCGRHRTKDIGPDQPEEDQPNQPTPPQDVNSPPRGIRPDRPPMTKGIQPDRPSAE